MEKDADPGSHPWKLQHALSSCLKKNSSNKKSDLIAATSEKSQPVSNEKHLSVTKAQMQVKNDERTNSEKGEEEIMVSNPKCYFLLNKPSYLAVGNQERENTTEDVPTLPEDQFHVEDIMSTFMKEQKENERQEKINKEKDVLNQKEDNELHDTEYLDTNDFLPGGKYHELSKSGNKVESSDVASHAEESSLSSAISRSFFVLASTYIHLNIMQCTDKNI